MRQAACPQCGAPIAFRSTASILAICRYCTSTIIRRDVDLENVGKMADLQVDGSPIQLEVQGWFRGVHFTVVGRIQLRYQQGLWNEWYLLFDDHRGGWLGEAQGFYAVSFRADVKEPVPAFDALAPDRVVRLGARDYRVTDVETATCVAGEGELPFVVGGGYAAPVADLAGDDGAFATIDYSEDPPIVFLGEYVDADDLKLSGMRQFDGW